MNQPALSTSAPLRYFSFAALYLAQGIPQGLLLLTIPAWLAANGMDAATVGGFVGIMVLPWTFKIVVGPLMDRYSYLSMGRRRPWLLGAQALLLLGMASLALIPEPLRHLPLLMGAGFLVSCCGAVQDVATDGLAVDVTPQDQQARANGLMWGSKVLALSGTLSAGTWAINTYGFAAAVLGLSAVLGLIMVVPSCVRERPREKLFPWSTGSAAPEALLLKVGTWSEVILTLKRGFLLRNSLLGAFCLSLFGFVVGSKDACLPLFTIGELGWANGTYANLVAAANLGSALAAMVLAGWLADRVGKVRIISIYMVLAAAVWAVLAFSVERWPEPRFVPTIITTLQSVETFCIVAVFATAMHLCWQRVAATQFTLYMVCYNVGYTVAGATLGLLTELLGWPWLFVLFGSVLLVVSMLLLFLRLRDHTAALDRLEEAHLQRLAQVGIQPELGVPGPLLE